MSSPPARGLLTAVVDSGHHRRVLLIAMIVLTTGYAGLFGFAILAAIMSPMVFDAAHGAREWSAFFAFLLFPFLVLFSIGLAWYGYGSYRNRLIPIALALPLIYGAAFWLTFS